MNKGEAVHRIKNADLNGKKLDDSDDKKIFIIAMLDNIPEIQGYHEKNCLEKGKLHYEENKVMLQKITHNRYKTLPEEEKDKKREYGRNRYQNMSDERKKGENGKKCRRIMSNEDKQRKRNA